ncbi:MAG: TetR/AcrR family transcriptional regulator [Candidatus Promineifilaceae bacterium]|nr:TetR/AcrR family transcriptional regulator [Candidatus Promineifilaceae bacterium]
MSSTREQFIEATCDLLEEQGYHATGLKQIVAESGSPKGSLYYYFPEGKEELAAEAIRRTGEMVAARIRDNLSDVEDLAATVRRFVRRIADHVEASGYRSGGPLMTVAMETAASSERLNLACREAYDRLQEAFAERLHAGGFSSGRAAEVAAFVTASIEGGIILSRTAHSGDPLRRVADELGGYLNSMQEGDG